MLKQKAGVSGLLFTGIANFPTLNLKETLVRILPSLRFIKVLQFAQNAYLFDELVRNLPG